MSRGDRTTQQGSGGSGDFLMVATALIMAATFILASPGLLILSLVNRLLGGWVTTSWAGSQILVTSLIISAILYVILYSQDERERGYRWRLAIYAMTTAWFPFSYYALKVHYFCGFLGHIDWYYVFHYFMFAMLLVISMFILGTGMLITGIFSVALGASVDLSQAWSWVVITQGAVSWLVSLSFEKSHLYNRFKNTWFQLNIIAMILLCIFRYEFLWHWPNEMMQHFFDKTVLERE
ncbi:hypothetical protein HAP94_01895 [Acidithiobacillus ferrivorans]|nr:hypothetical protein [Acidithiobacillus ferrivorans]